VQSISIYDRVLGCLLGGALGDAWGRPFEGVTSLAKFEIPAQSAFSDDTQLTLATCESLIECGGADPEPLAFRF
jgi:ADP-ribosyl-[dinitrogen reductase] hydrolase